jgi:sugar-specific transcriptional regulator TrmB
LSEETVRKTLRNFGLTEKETDIYIYLAKRGVLKGGEISKQTKTPKALVYRTLKSLQAKGLVESTVEFPARFTAVPFEYVIDLNIRAKQEEAAQIAAQKKELISYWQSIKKAGPDLPLEKFTFIEGNRKIYFKLSQMMAETRKQLSAITTVQGLARADQLGFFDAGSGHPLKSTVKFRFLTELTDQNISSVKELLKIMVHSKIHFEGRTPELGLSLSPQMTVRDQEEAMIFVTPRGDTAAAEQDNMCLWTNCKSLVGAFTTVFEDLWNNSTDIQRKIDEMEKGEPIPRTYVISDGQVAKQKYDETIQSAKKEIVILTSSKGLIESWKKMPQLREWTQKGVTVKIMAPIVKENLEAAGQLSKLCSVRHVPADCLDTTVIDGKHLFQFRTPTARKEKPESAPQFENTFYTNDAEYVEKTKTTLNYIWQNACAPSSAPLESIIGPIPKNDPTILHWSAIPGTTITPMRNLTEKDVLNEIFNAKKFPVKDPAKDIWRMYSSNASAAIHPPEHFGLPDMVIEAEHIEEPSSFGGGDLLIVFLWMETINGRALVPMTIACAAGEKMFNSFLEQVGKDTGVQTGKFQLVKLGELQIRIHRNALFAAWTVPITILPQKYVLPPACMMVEGYGDVKTTGYTMHIPQRFKVDIEQNYFDAFVTFMHPSSRYSGPGTDGLFVRDYIRTTVFQGTKDKLW